jgi:hypothetical protein
MPTDNTAKLEMHIVKTYSGLRNGIGLLAIALPLILSIWGYVKYGLLAQDSISAYYPHSCPRAAPQPCSRWLGMA